MTRSAELATLTIGEVASRTGMTVANLRNWEVRYGIPEPDRSAGGQRRYRESDCRLVSEILRKRESGVGIGAAVRQARTATAPGDNSIYQSVRRLRPDLQVHRMDKGLLLALTRAMEDHCCCAADGQILIGAFQRTRHFESSRQRWESMASTSARTIVFADFGRSGESRGVVRVPITDADPLTREWVLISDGPEAPASLLAWEPPGQDGRPEWDREFDVIWSVSPDVARQAARTAMAIAARTRPELGEQLEERLVESAPAASPDLYRAIGVFERTIDYLSRGRRVSLR